MRINNQALSDILSAIDVDGQAAVMAQVQAAYVNAKITQATENLSTAVSFEVSDWEAVENMLATPTPSQALLPVRNAIETKLAANDNTGLSVLFLMLYAANRSHFGG